MEKLFSFRWTSWYTNIFIVLATFIIPMVGFIKTLDWVPFTYFIVDTRYILVGLAILMLYLMFSMFIDQSRFPLLFEESRLATLAILIYGVFLWYVRPIGLFLIL